MDTIEVSSETEIDLREIVARLSPQYPIEKTASDGFALHGSGTRLYFSMEDKNTLFIDYSEVALVKRVIASFCDRSDWTVDNDFGTVLRGDAFVDRLRTQPDWNWRE